MPFLKKRKEKRKYVARPGIEPRTPDLRVRSPTDCSTRPGFCASKDLYDKLYLIVCIYLASETLYEGHENGIEAEVSATERPEHISVSS